MLFLLYLGLGACAGVMAGLFGIGGGLIIVPVLIFSFKIQGMSPEILTHMAVGTSLATMVVTSLSSIKAHQEEGAVNWSVFITLSIGILVGAFLGVYTAVNLSGHVLQKLLGVFAILVSAKMWFGFKVNEGAKVPGNPILMSAGVVIGAVSGMFGIGGGTLSVPYLRRISLTMKQAVGTSAACGFPIAVMGAISNMLLGEKSMGLPALSTGYVYWPAFLGIVLTSMLFARIGARMAHVLAAEKLQKMFALFLFIVGVQFLA
ncbi:sulfite exporter TauE/SafE family protein [Endozoicomonas sp. SCSIO W0465]|uniref:sulfite exporter TauE/SafE family protein n=1 Tax=Endozoicomonas sp. SCSIO W0465 TaxID=2918516 RepID=UPI002075FDA4|nr:sulfite exporter TauE/SafE family protein [Endozoicomonas sp. SCSIO W0465]USE38527.1 sulfite exporter TauE/SafE family protein [Endozoicomonas sp. SCSIO W0465]